MFDPLWAMTQRNRVVLWLLTALLILPLAGVYALTASDAAHGRISLAVLTAVLGAAFAVYQSFSGSYDAMEIESARPVLAAVGQLREALGHPAQPAPPAGTVATSVTVPDTGAPLAGGAAPLVELRGIRYTYPGSDRPVLEGLDLTIRPGELLAIVGLNGAGKFSGAGPEVTRLQQASWRQAHEGQYRAELVAAGWRGVGWARSP
jgi:ATP-binding cassette subfamily B protein